MHAHSVIINHCSEIFANDKKIRNPTIIRRLKHFPIYGTCSIYSKMCDEFNISGYNF